jgi:hypothetical protein
MKITKTQVMQLSVVSIFIGFISINSIFNGAAERMGLVSNAMVAALKYTLQNLTSFLDVFIYPASIFCILGFVVVYVPMLFLSFRNGRHS